MLILFCILIATLNTVAIIFFKKTLPIVVQLLVATLVVPTMNYVMQTNGYPISHEILNSHFFKIIYDINFSLILSYILCDSLEGKINKDSVKIALGSFLVPFLIGLVSAYFLLDSWTTLSAISIALLFSITAVPVLYLYLKELDYSHDEIKKLLQAAILVDLMCWITFALVKENGYGFLWAIIAGCMPLVYKKILKSHNKIYMFSFFAGILIFQLCKLNPIIFGIVYISMCNYIKEKINLEWTKWYQNWVAVPYILTFGMLQINFIQLSLSWNYLLLFIISIGAKLLGNYLGLYWANPLQIYKDRLYQSLLLNIRGITQIVFLNLLFNLKIINNTMYLTMMLMGLVSTLIPSIYKTKE